MISKKIIIVVGARPNFLKAAPLLNALRGNRMFRPFLVHTGQHYDKDMSDSFFQELELPRPDRYLGVGSGTHAVQTARVMVAFERVCSTERPDLVVVVGDVNSTLACALVAVKLGISVAHVEAGLRSFDRTMPEEINRMLTDHLSDLLFTSCPDGNDNLIREGIPRDKIFFVGNVMIDSLKMHLRKARASSILERLGLQDGEGAGPYALLTLHRPSNVDDARVLRGIYRIIEKIAEMVPVVFPVHPRTIRQMERIGLKAPPVPAGGRRRASSMLRSRGVITTHPLGYLDFLYLMSRATLVLTDSGGIQEETTVLGVPCLTLRSNTERPITLREGTNRLVGNDPETILRAVRRTLRMKLEPGKAPRYWDGRAAQRIVSILTYKLKS
jgi:UDP-N-acetylglucosamine 2-epimerase (non-hydrolysing)